MYVVVISLDSVDIMLLFKQQRMGENISKIFSSFSVIVKVMRILESVRERDAK